MWLKELESETDRKEVLLMAEEYYLYETFEGGSSDFDSNFTNYLNSKYSSGFKYESCSYSFEGDRKYAYCVFKRK